MRFPKTAYGPLIGTIWDPSPETQYHVLSLELAAESVKLESVEARVTNMVDPTESKWHTATSDRMIWRAIVGKFRLKGLQIQARDSVLSAMWTIYAGPDAYRQSVLDT